MQVFPCGEMFPVQSGEVLEKCIFLFHLHFLKFLTDYTLQFLLLSPAGDNSRGAR